MSSSATPPSVSSNSNSVKTRSGGGAKIDSPEPANKSKRIKLEEMSGSKLTEKDSLSSMEESRQSDDDNDNSSMDLNDELEEYEESEDLDGGGTQAEVVPVKDDLKTTQGYSDTDYPVKVLAMSDITKLMDDMIREVYSVMQLPPAIIRILLNHFKWDKDKLIETFYEKDQDELFKSANVINPKKAATSSVGGARRKVDCLICYDLCPNSSMSGLACGHRFCSTCWTTHLTIKITTEGVAQTISCPQQGCDIAVDEVTVRKFVTDPKVLEKYQYLLASNFVDCSRLVRWCSSTTGCTNAICAQWIARKPVTCTCGFTFCFQCGHDWHDPVTCELLKKWIKKCADDSETARWLRTYTKDCPKCKVQIEKDGGCNHMTCRNSSCKHEFCWVCLGKWPHTGTTCNRFDPTKQKDIEESRTTLNRYLFYYDRYTNHLRSLKFEHKLYSSVDEKMATLQANKMSWIESQYLKTAVDTLCRCRQTLLYTYSFAFYLEKTNQCMIFEDNQADLEAATEALSEILENNDDTIEFLLANKQKVNDKTVYVESRRKVLIDHVYEGYEKDWWRFFDP